MITITQGETLPIEIQLTDDEGAIISLSAVSKFGFKCGKIVKTLDNGVAYDTSSNVFKINIGSDDTFKNDFGVYNAKVYVTIGGETVTINFNIRIVRGEKI